MSLVAYGGSDESDEEEQESEAMPSTSKSDHLAGHISDEDDHFAGVSSSTGTGLHSFIFSEKSEEGEINQSQKINSTSLASLEDLPAPKKTEALNENMLKETELEAEVLPKASELAAAPKPPRKRQPAKITIPSLNDNEDEEEDTRKKQKPSNSNKSSGLFSLLPAPVHSSRKEINRPLIPHTLTKKQVPPKKVTQVKEISSSQISSSVSSAPRKQSQFSNPVSSEPSGKHMSTFNALTGYESDSDDDDNAEGSTAANFFSLGQSSDSVSHQTELKSSNPDVRPITVDSTVEGGDGNNLTGGKLESKMALAAQNDAPLDLSGARHLQSLPSASYSNLLPVGPSGHVGTSAAANSGYYGHGNIQGNMAYAEAVDEEADGNVYSSEVPSEDLKQFMSDKEFHRFQGKRKRGLEEELNFVDARVDDYVDPSELSKHMTEETEYVSAKKDKDNAPTSQQKRKKQITYLAFQAKEKEFELKNTWAANRQTKRQTQSKYGF